MTTVRGAVSSLVGGGGRLSSSLPEATGNVQWETETLMKEGEVLDIKGKKKKKTDNQALGQEPTVLGEALTKE